MTLGYGFPGSADDANGPESVRKALAGLILRDTSGVPRTGVFLAHTSALVSAKASMAVDVAAFAGVAVRGGGPVFMANDGTVSVSVDAAPASNSRIDVVYFMQHESASPYSDADDLPTIGVAKGTAGAVPVKPSIPTGAVELATILIPSGVSATNAVGVVITQTAPFTTVVGTPLPVRNSTERAALPTYVDGTEVVQLDTTVTYRRVSGAWKAWSSEWISWSPTLTNLNFGSTGSFAGAYRYENGDVRHRGIGVFGGTGISVGAASMTTAVTLANPSPGTSRLFQGESYHMDESTGVVPAVLLVATTGASFLLRYWGALNATAALSSTAPFTWAAGDRIFIDFVAPI
jgi:hypothetical protein